MGLLGMFARKTAVTLGRVGAQKNVSEANSFDNLAKSSNHHPRTKEEVAVMTLLENTKGGVRDGSTVNYPERGFEITIMGVRTVVSETRSNNPYTAEVKIFAALPGVETLICDNYASIGNTINEATASAVKKFSIILNSMFDLMDAEDEDLLTNEFDGVQHMYKVPLEKVTCTVGDRGIQQLGDLYRVIESELCTYLGAKKYYWVSIEVLFSGDHYTAKCMINNEEIERLSGLIDKTVRTFFQNSIYGQHIQQFMIIQYDRTYVRQKENYNKAYNAMHKFIRDAIPMIGNSAIVESYDELFEKMTGLTGDKHTAWEIMTFLAEIYGQQCFKMKGTELVSMNVGDKKLELTEFQISPIRVIKSEVEKFLENRQPSDEFNQNIFSLSGRFTAAMEALNNGVSEEDLAFGVLSCTAPDDYKIW